MVKEKLDEKIKAELFSANQETVISALDKIKVKGNKLYIPLLFDVLLSKPGDEIETEIGILLGTVKVKETVDLFIEALKNKKYKSIHKKILTACWQNGLEFHPYFNVFIDFIINDNFENAFEAFTVIDNMEFLPEPEIIEQAKQKIKKALKTAKDHQEYFLQEILAKIG